MSVHEIWMIAFFVVGYLLITIEHTTLLNKTAIALITAVICWMIQFSNTGDSGNGPSAHSLLEGLAGSSQIVLFLFGALAIVETINVHHGFELISRRIHFNSKRTMLWVVGFITFFLSSVLDNLTTTVIMLTLMHRLLEKGEDRLLIGGAIVIAANAGGAWTPIGDVTTTMLWIGGELSTLYVVKALFLPSLTCLIVALACLSIPLKGQFNLQMSQQQLLKPVDPFGRLIFFIGLSILVLVPVFKVTTGLPPFMGILLGLGALWLFTDYAHRNQPDRHHLQMPQVLKQIDFASVLFFLGILLCIDALSAAGLLRQMAGWMDQTIGNQHYIAVAIGLISAVIDNVPLVAASMGMYDLAHFPADSSFWGLVAYCAGTGGSILVIGSAAGVVFMGLDKVSFFWYLRRIGPAALAGYFAGIAVYALTT